MIVIPQIRQYYQQFRTALRAGTIFAALGNRVYPPTYLEEINEQCRIFYPLYAAPFFVAWLPYLSIDPLLFPNEPLFPALRLGLTIVGISSFVLRKIWNHPSKHRYISLGMLYYLIVATGVLTGLSKAHPSYIGGYCFLITVLGAMPAQLFHLYTSLVASLLVFAGLCFANNVHFDTPTLQYSLQDLISTVGVTILLSYGWSILRRNTYEKGRALQESNQRIQDQHRELEAQNHDLFSMNHEKDELIGIVSHDLKNPLAGIKGVIDILRTDDEQLSPDFRQKLLMQVNGGIERMFNIVKNLLDVHQLESGMVGYAIVPMDIEPHIEHILNFYSESVEAKRLTIHFTPQSSPDLVYADEQALLQVLDNLISNAIKYSPLGKNIFIGITRHGESVHIHIRDEGEGISASDQARLFTKFARLSAQPTGGEHSTGLGLSIVKKLVEAMNGEVWCESEVGEGLPRGATFTISLPSIVSVE
jgi:signal transduction histidine kinase